MRNVRRLLAALLAVVMLVPSILVPGYAAETTGFKDVPEGSWYAYAVDYVSAAGYMKGTAKDAFSPDADVTRAMFVTILSRVAYAQTDNTVSPFGDVAANQYYSGAIDWAAEKGIVNGVGGGLFAPYKSITRQDLAVMLYRFVTVMGYEVPATESRTYTDEARIAPYAAEAVKFVTSAGLFAGYKDGAFRPTATANRAQTAVIVMRLAQLLDGQIVKPEPMPAQSFDRTADQMQVSVNAPEGALPEGTSMTASAVTGDALTALQTKLGSEILGAVDISFARDGAEIEPARKVNVRVALDGIENAKNPAVVHVKDDGSFEYVASSVVTTRGKADAIEFEADSFSVYVVVDGENTGYKIQFMVPTYAEDGSYTLSNGPSVNVSKDDAKSTITIDGNRVNRLASLIPDPSVDQPTGCVQFYGWSFMDPRVANDDYNSDLADGEHTAAWIRQQLINAMDDDASTESVVTLPAAGGTIYVYPVLFYFYEVSYFDELGVTCLDTVGVHSRTPEASYEVSHGYDAREQDYALTGWYWEEEGRTVATENETITLTEDATLVASVTQGYWLIFYERPDHNTIPSGATYHAPIFCPGGVVTPDLKPAKEELAGYTFGEWFKDPTFPRGGEYNFNETIDKDTPLYAKWTPGKAKYTVVFWVQKNTDAVGLSNADKKYDYRSSYTDETHTTGDTVSVPSTQTASISGYSGNQSMYDTTTQAARIAGEKKFLTFNSANSNTSATLKNDGSTVLNVYFDRQTITYNFYSSDTDTTVIDYYYQNELRKKGDYVRTTSGSYPSGFYLCGHGPWASFTPYELSYTYNKTTCIPDGYATHPAYLESAYTGGQLKDCLDYTTEQNLQTQSFSSPYSYSKTSNVYYYDGTYGYYPIYYKYVNENDQYTQVDAGTGDYFDFDGRIQGLWDSAITFWPKASPCFSWVTGRAMLTPVRTSFTPDIDAAGFTEDTNDTENPNPYRFYPSFYLDVQPTTLHWRGQKTDGTYEKLVDTSLGYNTRQLFAADKFPGYTYLGFRTGTDDPEHITYSANGVWYGEANSSSNSDHYPEVSTEGTQIYAYYARNKYQIDYIVNYEVKHTESNIFYQQDHLSDLETAYVPKVPSGQRFIGWYDSPSGGNKIDFATLTMPNFNLAVYARFEPIKFRVFLYADNKDTATVDWDSSYGITWLNDQNKNFAPNYDDTIKEPTGTRASGSEEFEWELVGWYTDAKYEHPYNFSTILTGEDPLIFKAYDQTEATDPAGTDDNGVVHSQPYNMDAAMGRSWITQKITLYAKWRKVMKNANGVTIMYDAIENQDETGYFDGDHDKTKWTDTSRLYGDGAVVTARSAPAPDGEYQFSKWEIMRWNETTGTYEGTGKFVYPGTGFLIDLSDAYVTDVSNDCTHEDAGGFSTIVEVPAQAATCTAPGYTAHYRCTLCNKRFSDAQGENEVTLASVTVAALGHAYGTPTYTWTPANPTNADETAACTATAVCARDASHTKTETATVTKTVVTPATTSAPGTGRFTATFANSEIGATTQVKNFTIPQITGNTVHFSVPNVSGVTAPSDQFVEADNAADLTVTPTGTIEGYTFLGWVAGTVDNSSTQVTPLDSFTPTAETTLYALYRHSDGSASSYELLSSAPADWTGNYVITYGTTSSMYLMKGVTPGTNGASIESTANAASYSASGVTLNGTTLTNVANDYVFAVAKHGSYYSIQNAATGTYVGEESDEGKLAGYTTYAAATCDWTPGTLANASCMSFANYGATGTTYYPYVGYNTSNKNFWSASNSNTTRTSIRWWKENTSGTTWTTVINTYTVTYSVPGTVTAPSARTVIAGSSANLSVLPEGSITGWTFAGWSATEVTSESTTATPLTSYTPTGDVTLYALYSRTVETGGTYTRVTASQSDWSGKYVITYLYSTSLYALKGIGGELFYEGLENAGSIPYASTGMSLNSANTTLSNVSNYFVFNVQPSSSSGYYTIRSVATDNYVCRYATSDTAELASISEDFSGVSSYNEWQFSYGGNNGSNIFVQNKNNASFTKWPYLGFGSQYFWVDGKDSSDTSTNTYKIYLWKETTPAGTATYYSTAPGTAATRTITFNTPSGITEDSITVPANSPAVLPTPDAPTNYYFVGWTTSTVTESSTAPTGYYAGGALYTPSSDVTLNAIYFHNVLIDKYTLQTEVPGSVPGYYVISSGTTNSSYMLKTCATSGTSLESTTYRTAMSASNVTINSPSSGSKYLTNVQAANRFLIYSVNNYDGYYYIKNNDNLYAITDSSYLKVNSSLTEAGLWKLTASDSVFLFTNYTSASYKYLIYSSSGYFAVNNSSSYTLYLWKQQTAPYYTTSPSVSGSSEPALDPVRIGASGAAMAHLPIAKVERNAEATEEPEETETEQTNETEPTRGMNNNPNPVTAGESTYELATTLELNSKYLLVVESGSSSYVMKNTCNSGTEKPNAEVVSVSNNQITGNYTAYEVRVGGSAGAYTFQNSLGLLGITDDSNYNLCIGNTYTTWNYTSNKLVNTNTVPSYRYVYINTNGPYLNTNTSSSAATVRFYKLVESAPLADCTVSYNANASDATGSMTDQTLTSGSGTLTANGFSRTGYTFAGWNTAADGTGKAYVNRASVTLTGDVTLYAQWSKTPGSEETVSYKLVSAPTAGEDYVIVIDSYAVGNAAVTDNHYLNAQSVTVNSDDTVTVPANAVNSVLWHASGVNNTTVGWSFYNQAANKFVGLDAAYYLAPAATSPAWTYNGTDLNNNVSDEGNQVKESGSNFGKCFYYLASRDPASTGFTTTIRTGNNVKLYKRVITATVPATVTYMANGTQYGETVETTVGASVTLPTGLSSVEGYTFCGWSETAGNVSAGSVLTGTYKVNEESVVLYAVYSKATGAGNQYELVTSNLSDWSGTYVITYRKTTGMDVLKGLSDGTNYESSGVDGSDSYASTGINLGDNVLTNVNSLYTFTLAPVTGGYSIRNESTKTYLSNDDGTLKTYSTFSASRDTWTVTLDSGVAKLYNGSSSAYPYLVYSRKNSDFQMDTAPSNVYLWKETASEEYTTNPSNAQMWTVTFVDYDGRYLGEQSVEDGQTATRPSDPVREGYDFVAWTLNGSPFDFTTHITEDITLTASYQLQSGTHTVRFLDESGTLLKSVEVENGGSAESEAPTVTKEGFTFLRWSKDISHVTSDIEVKPIFVKTATKAYTVCLRAVYEPLQPLQRTHVYWYADNEAHASYDEGEMVINETFNVLDPSTVSTFTNPGHVFLGWARLPESVSNAPAGKTWVDDDGDGRIDAYTNLTAADIWLEYQPAAGESDASWTLHATSAQDGSIHVDNDANDVQTGTIVTLLTPTQDSPIHGLYAVWAPVFYVFHSSTGKLEAIAMNPGATTNGVNSAGKFDLTQLVPENYLYGGYYKTYGGIATITVSDETRSFAQAYADRFVLPDQGSGTAKWNAPASNSTEANYGQVAARTMGTGARFVSYEGNYLKDTSKTGNPVFWPKAEAYKAAADGGENTVLGTAMTPVAGTVYYLKEVPADFLPNKLVYVKADEDTALYDGTRVKEGELTSLYLLTAVDDRNYTENGFFIGAGHSDQTVTNPDVKSGKVDSVSRVFTIFFKDEGKAPLSYNAHALNEDITVPEGVSEDLVGFVAAKHLSYKWIQEHVSVSSETATFYLKPYWTTLDGVTVERNNDIKAVNISDEGKHIGYVTP